MSWLDGLFGSNGSPAIGAPPTTSNYLGAARLHAGTLRSMANDGMEMTTFLGGLFAALALGASIVASVSGDDER